MDSKDRTITTRTCRDCGLEKLYIADGRGPDRWHGLRCPECANAERKRLYDASGKHVPGRKRFYRQRAEIAAVQDGNSHWVTCSQCMQMKRYQPKASGKGGVGWRSLKCPDCSNSYARQWKATYQKPSSGICSECGAVGEYRQGNRCADCVRRHNAAYLRERRAAGKNYVAAHSSKICRKCRQRCPVAGILGR